MAVRLANGPVSWGVDFARSPSNPPWATVLDGIADAGYSWIELGPTGYLPDDPRSLREELAKRRLRVAGTFAFEPFHDRREHARIGARAHRTCELLAAVGGQYLVIVDLLSPARRRTAGRSEAAPRLQATGFSALVEGIESVAGIARHEYGLAPVVHPHAGTYVEFEDEIDSLLAALDPSLVGLCIDTGHAALADVDPVRLYRRYVERVRCLHLKDVSPGAKRRARKAELDFDGAVATGVFCRLGDGLVDFRGLVEQLERTRFDGFATVEQDRDPNRTGDPTGDARMSLSFLREIGFERLDPERLSD